MIENETLAEAAAIEDPVEEELTEEAGEPVEAEVAENSEGRAKLILKRAGAETEEVFEFGTGAIIGRFDPAVGPIDIDLGPLEEGVYVSRKHARFNFADGEWSVEDLGSSNGTFILRGDFEKVDSTPLADGDELSFGNARFVFRLA